MSAHAGRARKAAVWLLALVVSCVSSAAMAADPNEVAIGEPLRDATMRGLNTPPRRLAEFKGRPLLLNVWASWCGPCRAEMASLERLAWTEEASYFTILGISTDDYAENALAALKASNATITHFIDTNLELEKMLGATHLPLTVLVDADGKVVERIYGAREWDSPAALALIHARLRRASPK